MGKVVLEAELQKLLSAASASAGKAEGGDNAEEGRCVDVLKVMGKEMVTAELLAKTDAGKRVKKLCKHTSGAIKAAATATVDAWKECVRAEQKARPVEGGEASKASAGTPSGTGSQQPKCDESSAPSGSGRPGLDSVGSGVLESQDSLNTGPPAVKKSAATARPARCGDSTRDKIRDLLTDALSLAVKDDANLNPAEIAVLVEDAMFAQSGEVNAKYKAKYRTLGFNLKDPNNPDLRSKVLHGEIPPEILVNLSSDELGSNERRQDNSKIREHMKNEAVRSNNAQASTDMFQCGKCRQRKCTYYQMQTRSADEPMTTFVQCVSTRCWFTSAANEQSSVRGIAALRHALRSRGLSTVARAARNAKGKYDVVLSSGFLAFAHHSGFLKAVDDAGLEVGGVMGTSAGALTGSCYCAGYSPREIAQLFSEVAPITYLRPSARPWEGGLLSFEGVVRKLRTVLPATFEELDREFAVGVVTKRGDYVLIDSGPLPEAVAASAAIPIIFQSVCVPGLEQRQNPCKDGGIVDRVGLKGWRERRRTQGFLVPPPCLVHVVQRSSNFSGNDDVAATGEADVTMVFSPKSGVSLLNLGEFETAFDAAYGRAWPEMEKRMLAAAPPKRWWPLWGA
ncbi:hypothetical protein FOA52_006154 [Chlamydomonas sp. UWO 241]|nr:hypothetical protein FOA52_006154 [Chlamydomonas sp. UWO 241]